MLISFTRPLYPLHRPSSVAGRGCWSIQWISGLVTVLGMSSLLVLWSSTLAGSISCTSTILKRDKKVPRVSSASTLIHLSQSTSLTSLDFRITWWPYVDSFSFRSMFLTRLDHVVLSYNRRFISTNIEERSLDVWRQTTPVIPSSPSTPIAVSHFSNENRKWCLWCLSSPIEVAFFHQRELVHLFLEKKAREGWIVLMDALKCYLPSYFFPSTPFSASRSDETSLLW